MIAINDNLVIKNNIMLAPMAGITDIVFCKMIRKICKDCLVFSEMISCDAIIHHNKKTIEMLKMPDKLHPFGIQLFANNHTKFRDAVKIMLQYVKPDIIDINLGCPVNKVAQSGKAGSYLLKTPNEIKKIIMNIKEVTNIPISLKIRAGWDNKRINFLEIGKIANECKCCMITLHPRTKQQLYSGKCNYDYIKQLKNNVNINVIGNGNIQSVHDIENIMNTTKCDGIMIGRWAITNPWILNKVDLNEVKWVKRRKFILLHLKELCKHYGIEHGTRLFRAYINYYLYGINNCHSVINDIFKSNNYNEIKKLIKRIKN